MTITLARVDDRVIHGQTTTRWTKTKDLYGFIIVSDKIANDELRKKVLKAAADNYKIGIFNEKTGIEKIKQAKESDKSYFVISDSPQSFANILKMGGDFGKTLNIGCMNTRPGAISLGRTTAIDDEDYKAFEYLNDQGIDLQFQVIPSDPIRKWSNIKESYNSLKNK